jgi:tRNA pseudouridine38-40 synthase
MKIRLTISYDGSAYNGSQIQPDCTTVESKLQETLKLINIHTTLEFSGRTDKNVHAFAQVVSFCIPNFWQDLYKLRTTLNKMLPSSIYVRNIKSVKDDFHARFSAVKREYRYLISTKSLTPFNSKYLGYYKIINEEKINKAIKLFIGVHNFEYFSKKGSEPKSTIREIYDIKFYKYRDIYVLKFSANSYLRSQIRMMVDFIMKISQEKATLEELKTQLNNKTKVSWTLASGSGLYLSRIYYLR